jgi:hypothetical protein
MNNYTCDTGLVTRTEWVIILLDASSYLDGFLLSRDWITLSLQFLDKDSAKKCILKHFFMHLITECYFHPLKLTLKALRVVKKPLFSISFISASLLL